MEIATSTDVRRAERQRRRWPAILSALLTAAMIVGLGHELFGSGLAGLRRAVPTMPLFYVCFGLLYLCSPAADLLIFRVLWRIPWVSGFVALNAKRITNDVVLGYSGEVYLYSWARARAGRMSAPFGAVKDVTILSAVAGNAATVLLCAAALPFGAAAIPPQSFRTVVASAALITTLSILVLLFSKRLFSLPPRDLRRVFAIHCLRIAVSSLLLAMCWHFALPSVPVGTWLILSAGRLLVSRLPLIPNKDLLFANLAILLIGQDRALSEMIAFTSALTLLVHVGLIVVVLGGGLMTKVSAWRPE